MANVCEGGSPSLHIVLERVDPARNIAHYYVLSIEPTLFAKHTLIRRWGRIGCLGRERLQFFGGEDATRAQVTLEMWLIQKRKRSYAPRSEPARPCPALPRERLQVNLLVLQSGFTPAASPKQTAMRRREKPLSFVLPIARPDHYRGSLEEVMSMRPATPSVDRPHPSRTERIRLQLDSSERS
jgi:predicted DNA-binding WGR domain protein